MVNYLFEILLRPSNMVILLSTKIELLKQNPDRLKEYQLINIGILSDDDGCYIVF